MGIWLQRVVDYSNPRAHHASMQAAGFAGRVCGSVAGPRPPGGTDARRRIAG